MVTNTGNARAIGQATATFGVSTTGLDFTSLGVSRALTVPGTASRVFSFKLGSLPVQLDIGERPAIQLTETSASAVPLVVSYGSSATYGSFSDAERIVNMPPLTAGFTNNGTTLTGAIVDIKWNQTSDGADGLTSDDILHYDVYGSNTGAAPYTYVIAEEIPYTTSLLWDTQTAGITSGALAVLVRAGDGYSHTELEITGFGAADLADDVPPSEITDLVASPRGKSGSVMLKWTAPGDDYHNHGRADYYDVRWSLNPITSGALYNSATEVTAEPYPVFGGHVQEYEVTGLGYNSAIPYYFSIQTVDEVGNRSGISTPKATDSNMSVGGPRCGMCHTIAPSVVDSVGNHKLHGITLGDCAKCHGVGSTTYGLDHQDGFLKMGYGPSGPVNGVIAGSTVTYTDGGFKMYEDTTGFGGFGTGDYVPVGDATDNGGCFNFGNLDAGFCHGPAGNDPDGGGPLPTYNTPIWDADANLACARCHGNPDRTTDSIYDRPFDGTLANGGTVPEQILGAPLVDNLAHYDTSAGAPERERKLIGQHEKHLNYSFRFSKRDSCSLCHKGNYKDVDALDGKHADGSVDVELDLIASGPDAHWIPNPNYNIAGTCGNMSPESCHPYDSFPKWDSQETFDCVSCHTMGGVTPDHVTDPAGLVSNPVNGWSTDPMQGNCTYCHFGGHPQDDLGGTALILANSSQVGINYRSGGIHVRKQVGGTGTSYNTEAEWCWGCHDKSGNDISEWGTDTGNNNLATEPPNGSNYDYGFVTSSNWTTATWSSKYSTAAGFPSNEFGYKTGAIQSTHSTSFTANAQNSYNSVSPVGSPLAGSDFGYTEAPDAASTIRCSNCHDVHSLNFAAGDNPTDDPVLNAPPYLRGTWVRNPYLEDGAPWGKDYTTVIASYGAVPRAGGNEMGGYQIDQNNSNPTAGLALATSAGLCTLCHGVNVDSMDEVAGENLWIGTNGHSASAQGGTGSVAFNVFGDGVGGRPVAAQDSLGKESDLDVFNQSVLDPAYTATTKGYGYRSREGSVVYGPAVASQGYSFNDYFWGATPAGTVPETGYHAFTCSKCHNPHASRLPKLMITNCLDARHNTWQSSANSGNNTQDFWVGDPADVGEKAATWNTAQNCHRYDSNTNGGGGWNTVTPW